MQNITSTTSPSAKLGAALLVEFDARDLESAIAVVGDCTRLGIGGAEVTLAAILRHLHAQASPDSSLITFIEECWGVMDQAHDYAIPLK